MATLMMVIITTFTDPMMGLSYECEPLYKQLSEQFGDKIQFRYAMAVLVRDVHDFMIPADYADTEAQSIANYNRRLAQIYKSEERIGGLPINMDCFCLFDEQHTTSEPLCLAYKAVEMIDSARAERFLYNLRRATIVETRPTTHFDELLRVVRLTGIDEQRFIQAYQSPEARQALQADMQWMHSLGIRALPVCLLEYNGKQLLVSPLRGYANMLSAIHSLTDGLYKGVFDEKIR